MGIGEICSRERVFTTKDGSIGQAAQLMREHHVGDKRVRRVPVVDAGGTLAGIVSADDLLDLLADELTALVRLLSREQARERRNRT
jgi:CBS domain-containing protein